MSFSPHQKINKNLNYSKYQAFLWLTHLGFQTNPLISTLLKIIPHNWVFGLPCFLGLSWNSHLVKQNYRIALSGMDTWISDAPSCFSQTQRTVKERLISAAETRAQKWQLHLQPSPEWKVRVMMVFWHVLDNNIMHVVDSRLSTHA